MSLKALPVFRSNNGWLLFSKICSLHFTQMDHVFKWDFFDLVMAPLLESHWTPKNKEFLALTDVRWGCWMLKDHSMYGLKPHVTHSAS